MTMKELKKLNRKELIEMVMQLEQENEQLREKYTLSGNTGADQEGDRQIGYIDDIINDDLLSSGLDFLDNIDSETLNHIDLEYSLFFTKKNKKEEPLKPTEVSAESNLPDREPEQPEETPEASVSCEEIINDYHEIIEEPAESESNAEEIMQEYENSEIIAEKITTPSENPHKVRIKRRGK